MSRFINLPLLAKAKPILVVLGWATSISALTLGIIFLGYLLPKNPNGGGQYSSVINASTLPLWIYYAGNFAISVIAAMILSDIPSSLLSFFASYVGGGIITYIVLSLPDYFGCCGGVLEGAAVGFTFIALFPYVFLVGLTGTFVGMGLAEHYL